ncbi:MAG: carboxypeptidase M32 [Calditrichaeota bacterium]|nr:carboxypeptidase M32 [Calditrichota bacterium]
MNTTDVINHIKKVNNLSFISALLEWDQETNMPHKGGPARSEQLGILAGIQHDIKMNDDFRESLKAIDLNSCTDEEQVILKDALKDISKSEKCPKRLVEEIAKYQSLGQQNWAEAKQKNDFQLFKPYLSRLIDLKREYAKAIAPDKAVYDTLLDDYEPNTTCADIEPVFTQLRDFLVPFLERIKSAKPTNTAFMNQAFPIEEQEDFGIQVIEEIGFDFDKGRVDLSVHPFCTNFSTNDVRITTSFDENNFTKSFFGLMHESGHAMYEQGMDETYHATAMAAPISLGIHESQSRLWENMVGRSRQFWTHYFPEIKSRFKNELKNVKFEDFLRGVNQVKASLIRTEADEVTYNLHVMIRFEIEQAIFNDNLPIDEIPRVWNEKYQSYLGITPPTDSEGCLQDVHWSLGLFGYFPTYTLGNIYSAQFFNQAKTDIKYLEDDFSKGDFSALKKWLNEHIHIHGKRYSAIECLQRSTGEGINPQHFINYLENKFSELFNL